MTDAKVVRFRRFVLDVGQRLVTRDGHRVHLTPKAFDFLVALIDSAPDVVSKDQLHHRLWSGTFVTDATIASVVKELRRALDGEGSEPLIRTAHGVGFAFGGSIEVGDRQTHVPSRLWLISGARRVLLSEGVNAIGRDPGAAVWLDTPLASRQHARITVAREVATIEDLGSKNCTLVNDRAVTQPTRLTDGDSIQIASVVFRFHSAMTNVSTETAAHSPIEGG